MVPDAPQVEEVLDQALTTLPEHALFVDMSTTSPTASRAIAERVAPRDYVEAPVSGSKPGAESGTLTIFAGGDQAAFDRAMPLFQAMGERIVHVGPLGHGQMAKLLTNAMGAVNAAMLAEAVRTAKAADLDPEAFLEVASASAGASAMLNLKGKPMFEENFEPVLFKLDHMLKDLRHTLDEARALGIELRLPSLAEGFYERASETGHGNQDFGAVYTGVDDVS
jgi:3-hydroxyisobutyrate dehydrogenase-like beta-hydroxyacid dehydrogenase